MKPFFKTPNIIRNFIFGVEDSLVSTVGLVSGIAVAGISQKNIILTGIVLIFVEAFSMGIGVLLSEHTADEAKANKEMPLSGDLYPATVMFFSYFVAGFLPLGPYFIFKPIFALPLSIGLALLALFLLGALTARVLKRTIVQHGLQMLLIGGAAILIGTVVGSFVKVV